tara:strand:+ start:552 stop:2027 length:1476 start_codon:yes stop_codon:yes gene_type:complete
MAFKKIGKKPLFTKNGKDYYPFWEAKTGNTIIQIENPSASDKPIFEDGNWNSNSNLVGLTDQEKAVYWDTTKQSIQKAYNASPVTAKQGGKKTKNAVLPQWVKLGINPNQTALTPGQPVLGTGVGPGVSGQQLSYGVPQPSQFGEIISAPPSTYTNKFIKPIDYQKSLDGSKYPIDMDTLTQDHVVISSILYKPAFSEDLFGKGKGSALKTGLQSQGNAVQRLATVYLPMPGSILDANTVDWQGDELGALAADALAGIDAKERGIAAADALTGGGGTLSSLKDLFDKTGAFLGGGSPEFKNLATTAIDSKILNMQGYAVSPESILARKSGIIPNNNNELLFKGVTMRSFSFSFKMSPRSSDEAAAIRSIIRWFKVSMAAKKAAANGGAGVAGGASFFLGTPHVFEMKFMTNINGKVVENPAVGMMKPMALKKFGCNYTPDGLWAAYSDGQPVQVTIACDFQELEPIFDTDYIGSSGVNKNLRPVADNAVGW